PARSDATEDSRSRSPAAFLPRPRSLSRNPIWLTSTRVGHGQYPPRGVATPRKEAQKTPKPANPRVHRLWLAEHTTLYRLPSSARFARRSRLAPKRRTWRTARVLATVVGTLT